MIRTPGSHEPNVKNRSSKQYYNLTRIGIRHMNEWHKRCGIAQYTPPKRVKEKTSSNTATEINK